jgi:hypothetical protein
MFNNTLPKEAEPSPEMKIGMLTHSLDWYSSLRYRFVTIKKMHCDTRRMNTCQFLKWDISHVDDRRKEFIYRYDQRHRGPRLSSAYSSADIDFRWNSSHELMLVITLPILFNTSRQNTSAFHACKIFKRRKMPEIEVILSIFLTTGAFATKMLLHSHSPPSLMPATFHSFDILY